MRAILLKYSINRFEICTTELTEKQKPQSNHGCGFLLYKIVGFNQRLNYSQFVFSAKGMVKQYFPSTIGMPLHYLNAFCANFS